MHVFNSSVYTTLFTLNNSFELRIMSYHAYCELNLKSSFLFVELPKLSRNVCITFFFQLFNQVCAMPICQCLDCAHACLDKSNVLIILIYQFQSVCNPITSDAVYISINVNLYGRAFCQICRRNWKYFTFLANVSWSNGIKLKGLISFDFKCTSDM